jgi:hypothetical protein
MSFLLSILASVFGRLFGNLAGRLFPQRTVAQKAIDTEQKIAQDAANPVTQSDTEKALRHGNF